MLIPMCNIKFILWHIYLKILHFIIDWMIEDNLEFNVKKAEDFENGTQYSTTQEHAFQLHNVCAEHDGDKLITPACT